MKRRSFLKGVLGVSAAVVVPNAISAQKESNKQLSAESIAELADEFKGENLAVNFDGSYAKVLWPGVKKWHGMS